MAVLFDLVQEAALTTGGPTQDYPNGGSSVFSAAEPVKAGLFYIAPSTTNGTALDHARFSFGMTDGTRHRCFSIRSRDAQATTSCVRQAVTNALVWIYSASATTAAGEMSFSSLSNDRITGSWATFPPSAWLVNAFLAGGSDLQAYVGEFTTSSSQDGTTTVDATSDPSFGFEFDVLITASRITAINGTSGTNAILCIGMAVRMPNGTIKQGCLSFSDEDGLAAPNSRLGAELEDDRIVRSLVMGTPTEGDSGEITATSSVGFTVTKRGALGGTQAVAFLALKFNGALHGYDLLTNTSRTTTGSQTLTSGFSLQALLGLFTHLPSLNTLDTGNDGATFGFGAAVGASKEFCSSYMSVDNVGTSDTKCETSDKFCDVPTSAGAAGITFDVTAMPNSAATGADFNYSNVLGTARQQLILALGRSSIRASARTVGGGSERSPGRSTHAGKARTSAQDLERGLATSSKRGRAAAQAGSADRALASKGAKGRAQATPGASDKARAQSSKAARGRALAGSLETGKPTLQAGGTSITATGRGTGQTTGRAVGSASHFGRARIAAQAAERGSGKGNHPARAASAPAVSDRALAKAGHSGRARGVAGGVSKARAQSSKGGRARDVAGAADRAVAKAGKGGRARSAPGSAERAIGASGHGGRAQGFAGALERGQASLQAGASSQTATGRNVGQTLGKARATASHKGRAAQQLGAASKAAGKSTHQARAKATAGESERALGKAQHAAKAKGLSGGIERAPGSKKANSKASNAPNVADKAKAVAAHGGRAIEAAGAQPKAAGKHSARGRAKATTGATGRSGIPPEAAMGFYERTAKRVRQALKGVSGSLAIQWSNLPFTEPTGTVWARAWINFDEVREVQYGAGQASYRVPGELVLDIRGPIQSGKKALLELAESLSAGLEQRLTAGIVYSVAKIGQARDGKADEYRLTMKLPFHAEDSGFARVEPGAGDGDDGFDGAERAIRSRFKDLLPDVAVSYDNLPQTTGATWVRLKIDESDSWDAAGVRRSAGIMTAEIHVPLQRGERAAFQLADRIVAAFRMVDAGGVKFSIPYLQSGKQGLDEWVMPVYAPWTVDRA